MLESMNTAEAALAEAAQQVLETMFFVAPLGEVPPGAPTPEPWVAARLTFRGEPSGAFAVSLSEAAARTMAANFLGVERERDLSSLEVSDVISELANMICGSVLSRLETESEFELGTPETVRGPEDPHAGRTLVRSLELEHGFLTASMEFSHPA